MTKACLRIVAFFLIPCLVADPSWAALGQPSPTFSSLDAEMQTVFNQEALAAQFLSRPKTLETGIPYKNRITLLFTTLISAGSALTAWAQGEGDDLSHRPNIFGGSPAHPTFFQELSGGSYAALLGIVVVVGFILFYFIQLMPNFFIGESLETNISNLDRMEHLRLAKVKEMREINDAKLNGHLFWMKLALGTIFGAFGALTNHGAVGTIIAGLVGLIIAQLWIGRKFAAHKKLTDQYIRLRLIENLFDLLDTYIRRPGRPDASRILVYLDYLSEAAQESEQTRGLLFELMEGRPQRLETIQELAREEAWGQDINKYAKQIMALQEEGREISVRNIRMRLLGRTTRRGPKGPAGGSLLGAVLVGSLSGALLFTTPFSPHLKADPIAQSLTYAQTVFQPVQSANNMQQLALYAVLALGAALTAWLLRRPLGNAFQRARAFLIAA